jgi:hypothetical protein
MKIYEEMEVHLHTFIAVALDGGKHSHGRISSHWIRGWRLVLIQSGAV